MHPLQVRPSNPNFKVSRVLQVELQNPNILVGPDGRVGTWTTIYDEAFELNIDGWKYLTFFRYTPRFNNANPS